MVNKDDIAWTITTGFYPELAAGLKYTPKGKGKGPVGAKYLRKRGFTDSSIVREQSKSTKKGKTWTEQALDIAKSGGKGGADAGSLSGKKLFAEKTFTDDTGAARTYWKFRGGSESYKLHGDQVWYMGAAANSSVKGNSNIFQEYINDVWGNKNPDFANIYSRMEPRLAAEAIALAEDMFDMAIEEVEKELEAGAGTERSAEEIGYKEGDFEYMSHAEAMRRYPHLQPQLKSSAKMSKANELDMVKIKGEGEDAIIEHVQDVTEMDVLGKGQHGITRVPKELKEAIENAKSGGGTELAQIKEAMIRMYQKSIKSDYNPLIKKMKKEAGIGGKSGGGDVGDKKWDDVLKGINNSAKIDPPSSKVSTQTIGKVLGQTVWKTGFHKMNQKSAKQTSIEYIAHIMGSMNEAMASGFKQSHRVYDMGNGMSVYATVPMEVNQNTWLFKPEVVVGMDVFSGYSATQGQELKGKYGLQNHLRGRSKAQKQAYSMCKVTGMAASKTGIGMATANMGIVAGARPATVVTIPANEKIEKMLIDLMVDGMPDLAPLIGRGGTRMKQNTFGLGKRKRDMKREAPSKQPMFWALPYVGVLQSEFKE